MKQQLLLEQKSVLINRTSLRIPFHNSDGINIADPSLQLRLPAIPQCHTEVKVMYERAELGKTASLTSVHTK